MLFFLQSNINIKTSISITETPTSKFENLKPIVTSYL